MERIDIGLRNFYGKVEAVERDGKYYLELGCYSGVDSVEISEGLFFAIVKELR
ncbi:hypothetical protein [Brevibacillus brevis]|uniref:hypothetical protein n=1 Tax=Brevibacillus brevis TaxID=1393 RepID=UPI00163BAF3D|nr:hypothetical protein [Lysinibacillus sp. SDF0063]